VLTSNYFHHTMPQDLPGIKSAKFAIIGLSLLSVGGVLFAITFRFSETIYVKGNFESSSQPYSLRSEISAPVTKIHLRVPTLVKRGDLLISFDCTSYYRRLKDSANTIELISSEVDRLQLAKRNVDTLAEDSIKLSTRYADLYERLSSSGAVSRMQALDSKQRVRQSQIQRLQQSLESQNKISAATSRLIASRAEHQDLLSSIKHCNLFSPANGIVTNIAVSNSELVETGREVLTLQKSASKDILRLQLNPGDLKFVRPGVKFRFTVDGYSFQKYGYLSATVLTISDTSDQVLQSRRSLDSASSSPQSSTFDAIAIVRSPLSSTKQLISSRVGLPITAEFISDKKSFVSIFSDQFLKIERAVKSIQSRF